MTSTTIGFTRSVLSPFLECWLVCRQLCTAMTVMIRSVVRVVQPSYLSSTTTTTTTTTTTNNNKKPRVREHHVVLEEKVASPAEHKSMDELLEKIRCQFEAYLDTDKLFAISQKLQKECRERMLQSDISMLPSYQHTLPSGHECGDFLALDVGGSTFRIALITLTGKSRSGGDGLQIRRIRSFAIDEQIRRLKGQAFFDWMAERIGEMLSDYNHMNGTVNARLPMGLAWSFPVEQTSPRTGRLLAMGKGFNATHGVEGQDLSELIMRSCNRKGLNVEMRAIVNDGAATLMSQAYRDPTTRMSLILGTGTNAGVYLPVQALGSDKFGERPDSWYESAEHVLVNTELSMVGEKSLPKTPYDEILNRKHLIPNFQPLEYLVTGRYLGEIVRLILVEAIQEANLFDGHLPDLFTEEYSLDARLLAAFESDTSPTLDKARQALLAAHPFQFHTPRLTDLLFVREITKLVTHRAAAYLATALHALWKVRTESEGLQPGEATHVTVACNGTIVEKYPGYRELCQKRLDELCVLSGAARGAVTLKMAPESSIFGAAVAVACMQDLV